MLRPHFSLFTSYRSEKAVDRNGGGQDHSQRASLLRDRLLQYLLHFRRYIADAAKNLLDRLGVEEVRRFAGNLAVIGDEGRIGRNGRERLTQRLHGFGRRALG